MRARKRRRARVLGTSPRLSRSATSESRSTPVRSSSPSSESGSGWRRHPASQWRLDALSLCSTRNHGIYPSVPADGALTSQLPPGEGA